MKPSTKAFQITGGRGFKMTFPNGYTVSVQFGSMNYCGNHHCDLGDELHLDKTTVFLTGELLAGQNGCNDAETAIIGPDGKFVSYDQHSENGFPDNPEERGMADDVQPHMTAMDVLTMMMRVAALPPLPKQLFGVEDVEGEVC